MTGHTIREQFTYGCDQASNRLCCENTVAGGKDECCTQDGADRLATFDRGNLNEGKPAISGTPVKAEAWGLDLTGNGNACVQKTSGTTDLNRTRDHDAVNAITEISARVGTVWIDPVHDRSGDMTKLSKPSSPADGLTCVWDPWNR